MVIEERRQKGAVVPAIAAEQAHPDTALKLSSPTPIIRAETEKAASILTQVLEEIGRLVNEAYTWLLYNAN